jgi:16S rRNA (guanine527-N7)-methyltransferase
MPTMDELTSGSERLNIQLSDAQIHKFESYYRELVSWNRRFNLTSILDYKEVQLKHFLDSLTVALALPVQIPKDYRMVDVGAGAGFPGLPLKIVFEQIKLTLVEATGKKAEFLKYVDELLRLEGTSVLNLRAEEAARSPDLREKFDAVVARGLAPLPTLVELTLPFLKTGGRLVAQKKGDIAQEVADSRKAIRVLGGELEEVKPIELPEFSDNRFLVIVGKITQTPENYPRRDGVPAKKPII